MLESRVRVKRVPMVEVLSSSGFGSVYMISTVDPRIFLKSLSIHPGVSKISLR